MLSLLLSLVFADPLLSLQLGVFASFSVCAYSLFSFLLGDSLRQFMLLLAHGRGPAVAIIFTVVMFFLFAYLILNIVIAITEHSYFSSRVRRRLDAMFRFI
jgi:hypothetical protein